MQINGDLLIDWLIDWPFVRNSRRKWVKEIAHKKYKYGLHYPHNHPYASFWFLYIYIINILFQFLLCMWYMILIHDDYKLSMIMVYDGYMLSMIFTMMVAFSANRMWYFYTWWFDQTTSLTCCDREQTKMKVYHIDMIRMRYVWIYFNYFLV